MKYLYLVLDLFTFISTFSISFGGIITFKNYWKSVFKSILITAIPFILWDIIFTNKGVWGFNYNYCSGYKLFNLPIEEILFFIVVPYACLFVYQLIKKFTLSLNNKLGKFIFICLLIIAFLISFFNFDKLYTCINFLVFGLLCAILIFRKIKFFPVLISFALILIPFFIINGVLTGIATPEPVVWYNNEENLGIRIITIPIEDFFYGFSIMISNVIAFEFFEKNTHQE